MSAPTRLYVATEEGAEGRHLAPVRLVLRDADEGRVVAVPHIDLVQPHESARLLVRSGPEQDRIDGAEYRGRAADPNRNRQDRDHGESWRLPQRAQAEHDIAHRVLEQAGAPSIAHLFLDLLHAAERACRVAPSPCVVDARFTQRVGLHVDVKTEFLRHLPFFSRAMEESARTPRRSDHILMSGWFRQGRPVASQDRVDRGCRSVPGRPLDA